VVKTGKTPVIEGAEWRKLLAAIPATTLRNLRDRALIATLIYSFARTNAALEMEVEDLRPRNAGWTVRLHEKGSKEHAMTRHHALAEALRAYIDAAGIAAPIGCHTSRATGITAYLANGGALGHAQEIAAHESPRTTKLYDRTKERLTQDKVERIRL
jgi:integrase